MNPAPPVTRYVIAKSSCSPSVVVSGPGRMSVVVSGPGRMSVVVSGFSRTRSRVSQPAGKPNSVRLRSVRPHGLLEIRRDDHSSSPAIARRVQQPTRWLWTGRPPWLYRCLRTGTPIATLFGLAPCGVLPAIRVATDAVRSYRTFSPLPLDSPLRGSLEASSRPRCRACPERAPEGRVEGRYIFCATNPSSYPARALPGALPFGVRTFLSPSHFAVARG
jgi:hypothetical protein